MPGLAANILKLLNDPALRAKMGAYGRTQVLERFTAKRMADDAGAAYEAVLSRA